MSHKAAAITVTAAGVLDLGLGWAFAVAEHLPVTTGLYWAVTTATTVGFGDVTPHNPIGRVIAVAVALTVVPLFAATFSLFTSALTTTHVRRSEHRIKEHVEQRLREHHASLVKHMEGGHDG